MLIYTGGGYGGSLDGVPARDLSDEEVEQCGGEKILLATKLYQKPHGDKAVRHEYENKAAKSGGGE